MLRRSGSQFLPLAGLLLGMAFCAAVYLPGLRGDFVFDDWPNIIQNSRLQVDEITAEGLRSAAFSAEAGTLKRPVSMLSFWANYYSTGLDPLYFKITNLVIHLLNGLGLFALARLLLKSSTLVSIPSNDRDGIALCTALIWLLHPLNVTSVLYVVQRMTSLSATFVILGLLCYVVGRERLAQRRSGFPLILLGLFGFGGLAVLSKENGVLLPLYMAAIELALFRLSGLDPGARRWLKVFFLATVAAPLLAAAVFVALEPDWLLRAYQTRAFTLTERLLTETRVMWLYLAWLVAPTRASLGLFHDDIQTSHGLLDPPSTALAIVGLVVVCAAALRWRARAPLLGFAVAWYLAGHVLESSAIGLELVHEHRNYLPAFAPLLGVVYLLWLAAARFPAKARFALPLVFLLAFSAVTFGRSLDWSDLRTLQLASARDHPSSSRSNYEAGTALGNLALQNPELAPKVYDDAKRYLERAAELDDTSVSPQFGLILLDATARRPVDEASIERLSARLGSMPMRLTVIEPFKAFVAWATKGVVVMPERMVGDLFESALDNPTADHRTKALLLSLWSSYYYNVAGDAQNAVTLAMSAVEEDPSEPTLHISLANLAMLLGNSELASREIAAADHNDPLGRFSPETKKLAESLRENDRGGAPVPRNPGPL